MTIWCGFLGPPQLPDTPLKLGQAGQSTLWPLCLASPLGSRGAQALILSGVPLSSVEWPIQKLLPSFLPSGLPVMSGCNKLALSLPQTGFLFPQVMLSEPGERGKGKVQRPPPGSCPVSTGGLGWP